MIDYHEPPIDVSKTKITNGWLYHIHKNLSTYVTGKINEPMNQLSTSYSKEYNTPEKKLVKLRGKGREETPKRRDKTAHDGGNSGRFPPAERNGNGRYEQGHSGRHCPQPSCKQTPLNYAVTLR